MNKLLKKLGLDAVYGIDIETYYDSSYSLRRMATTEYITDPRFELQLVAVQKNSWAEPKVMLPSKFKQWAKTVDWSRTGMLGHHCQFDAFALSRHCGIKPKFYLDTLSMARPVMPVQVGGSLHALAKAFGFSGKARAQALVDVKGKRLKDFSKDELKALTLYAGEDIAQTWGVFHKLKPYLSIDQLKLIDLTVEMYAQPSLLVDTAMVDAVHAQQIESKAALVAGCNVDKADLVSNDKFAALLREAGVEPPLKISKRTGKTALALSKQDLNFKELLKHKSKRVRELVRARMAVKTSILETRAERMSNRSINGAMPVYLNYFGAKTGRWSGGDKSNLQNLSRGSELRKAIYAPPGHSLIIADLAQIEARILAWISGQRDVLDAFREYDVIVGVDERGDKIHQGPDVYRIAAAKIYNKPISQVSKEERFIGKIAVLMLGYGAGHLRYADTLRIGAMGPAVDIVDSLAADIVAAHRSSIPFIVANWRRTQNNAKSAFMGRQYINDGVLSYEGFDGRGFTYLPDGTGIRYDGLECDEEGMRYISKARRTEDGTWRKEYKRLYGGLLVENNVQALARAVICEHILAATDELKNARLAMTVHDEIVLVVPTRSANKALKVVERVMSTPPTWAPDLPLAVDAHISSRYDK